MRSPILGLLLAATLLSGCSGPSAAPEPSPSGVNRSPDDLGLTLADARSTPREDSVYPQVGDPSVDALHYDLDLTWQPSSSTLTGTETLVLRTTTTGDSFRLDLGRPLRVTSARLDGKPVDVSHPGKDLVVHADVKAGDQHTLVLRYTGRPEPVHAPTTRKDVERLGWTTTPDGGTWTMQEPYGAYTWYAVNDQPSDKAFYDITVHAPAPMVGVANGQLVSQRTKGGSTTSRWHLAAPAASYLVTVAIGDYRETDTTSSSGLPITFWTPRDRPDLVRGLTVAPRAVDWLEKRLGPFPFPSLGIVLVDSHSGMETQSMITLGMGDYTTSPTVIVHEIAHQWYGDEVTPSDWSDVWMNEGMTTYLAEGMWASQHYRRPLSLTISSWAGQLDHWRAEGGPPAAYEPQDFALGNVYYIPAVMWDQVRHRLGDRLFMRLAREWPQSQAYQSRSRDQLVAWWDQESGEDLAPLFHAWLLGAPSVPVR